MLQKFKNGEVDFINRDQLYQILESYGIVKEINDDLHFAPSSGDWFEYATIMGNEQPSGIFFNRPGLDIDFIIFLFDILSLRNTFLFDPNYDFVIHRNGDLSDLHEEIKSFSDTKFVEVSSAEHLVRKINELLG